MKSILFVILALSVTACTTTQYKQEWVVDPNNKPQMAQFMAIYNDCKDFAYRSKVAGSRYSEADIHNSCIQRKGYELKTVEVTSK